MMIHLDSAPRATAGRRAPRTTGCLPVVRPNGWFGDSFRDLGLVSARTTSARRDA
jgi:hypothetical protein